MSICDYDLIGCIGSPKAGTTFLYDCFHNDPRFSPFLTAAGHAQKEIYIWDKWSPRPGDPLYNDFKNKRPYSISQYYEWLNNSDKPCLDFSLNFREAYLHPDNVIDFTSRYKCKFMYILRDPVDVLISAINFSELYGVITNSKKPVHLEKQLKQGFGNHEGFTSLMNLPMTSKWVPAWQKVFPELVIIDYDRLHDGDYLNMKLGTSSEPILFDLPKSNVTKNKKLKRELMDPESLTVLENFYAKDIEFNNAILDK